MGERCAPTVLGGTPEGGSAPRSATVDVQFSQPMDKASAEAAFALDPPAGGSFAWTWQDRVMVFRPSKPLSCDTAYTAAVSTEARDALGTPPPRDRRRCAA